MNQTASAPSSSSSSPPAATPSMGRLKWHSRRALLELDLLLERFWQRQEAQGRTLDDAQTQSLWELLQLEDHDLWDMLCGRQPARDPRWQDWLTELTRV